MFGQVKSVCILVLGQVQNRISTCLDLPLKKKEKKMFMLNESNFPVF